jgi:hypothetical protein
MSQTIKIDANKHLAKALLALSEVPKDENGRVSWESNKLERGTFELIYSLSFKPPIDDHVKDGALWYVLNECARAKNFSTSFFLQRLRAFITTHFSKQLKTVVAIGQINCNHNVALPRTFPSLFQAIEFRSALPRLDQSVIDKLSSRERARLELQNDFLYVTCSIKTTDERSALDAAYRNIKYCFGVLNLMTGGYGVGKRFGFPNAPIGKFLSGSTIFTIDRRKRALGGYLWENQFPTFFKSNFSVWHKVDGERIRKFARFYVSDLAKVDFREKLAQSIILFQEGLETRHIDIALLKFWTGIEVLCARETKESTDKVVQRASSIFTDHEHAVMRLNFIQEFRNKIVHRGDVGDHALLCAQWGSVYLSGIIEFFLFNRYKLRKHSELLDYLSTPLDRAELMSTMSLYRKRLKTLKG